MLPWTVGFEIWRLQVEAWTIAAASPVVIGLRLSRAWRHGGDPADREWQRMVSEKMLAVTEAQARLASIWFSPTAAPDIARAARDARSVLNPYSRRVRANLRRLS